MPRPSQRTFCQPFVSLLCCALLVGIAGCGSKEEIKTDSDPSPADASGKMTDENAVTERPVLEDPAAQLKADLDDAIILLENGNVAVFIERYSPLNEFDKLRQVSTIEEIADMLKKDGLFEKVWLSKLRGIKDSEIEFLDSDKSRAKLVSTDSDNAASVAEALIDPTEEKVPDFEGFPGDVQEAIKQAIAALEAGDHKKFVENLFPPSELVQATSEEGMASLLARLKEHPQMVERMLADLKALQTLAPTFDAANVTATFELNPGTPEARTVQFEKAETWRMADLAKQVRMDIYLQSLALPIKSANDPTVEWVRIREHWRLADTP